MNFRRAVFALLTSSFLLSGLNVRSLSAAPVNETLAHVHWLGLKRLSADTNSAQFMKVWQLPQTTALIAQTLNKFSRWPGGGATNAASALLRPLLDDLVMSESYLEVHAATNLQTSTRNPQIFLALRLSADRARLWQTNLPAVLDALARINPAAANAPFGPGRIKISRLGDWTLVSAGQGASDVVPEFSARIKTPEPVVPTQAITNYWLETDLNLPDLAEDFPLSNAKNGWGELGNLFTLRSQLSTLNSLHLTVAGARGNVITRGIFDFSRPLDLVLPPWEIPTNFIHDPLTSFTAVRGLAPWLAVQPFWQKLQFTPPPNQMYFWAMDTAPFQTHFAAPLPLASNQVSRLAARLVQTANPWLATNSDSMFEWDSRLPGLAWNNLFIVSPFLKPVVVNQHDYLLGGLLPLTDGDPMPDVILHAVLGTTNLVYYHAEQTGIRIEQILFISQLIRITFGEPQLPPAATATVWLKNLEPLMNGSTTVVTQSGTGQFTLTRVSTIGFNALELHLLADWLESPQFPYGLHTFLAPPDKKK